MTVLEAFKQAQRERGYDDAEIEKRLQMCGVAVPLPERARTAEIPEGMERKVIDAFKAMSAQVEQLGRKDPALLKRLREAEVAKHNKGN